MLRIASVTMKPGQRVIWLRSPGRSLMSGCRIQEVPGVIVHICRHRIRISVWLDGRQKLVSVDPENVLCDNHAPDEQ